MCTTRLRRRSSPELCLNLQFSSHWNTCRRLPLCNKGTLEATSYKYSRGRDKTSLANYARVALTQQINSGYTIQTIGQVYQEVENPEYVYYIAPLIGK